MDAMLKEKNISVDLAKFVLKLADFCFDGFWPRLEKRTFVMIAASRRFGLQPPMRRRNNGIGEVIPGAPSLT
ncbi:hypothetical protein [Marinibacterium profundimaris]|uniref:hypothetical protein n=1 Tax=Marinibacterium profundimaris TaxID=1679460 RepID=UPI00117C7C15|nr:hypothetical protein [Marinibacterium profundimaris]